jgi:hypothetical protein
MPALTRSWIMARSNSAKTPSIPNMALPEGVGLAAATSRFCVQSCRTPYSSNLKALAGSLDRPYDLRKGAITSKLASKLQHSSCQAIRLGSNSEDISWLKSCHWDCTIFNRLVRYPSSHLHGRDKVQ